jgi:hemicentin
MMTMPLSQMSAVAEELPPPDMSSLAFVFDRTGSMNDDLLQVRQGAKGIFETVMKQRKKLIYNYVLVLFHDPEVKGLVCC